MASANRSPSPSAHIPTPERDHAADGDDSLARKRQRLSEEADIVIEADEPEDIGASLNTAIMIDEDGFDDSFPVPYSETFDISHRGSSLTEQLMEVYRWTDDKFYSDASKFQRFASWLHMHITTTTEHEDRWQEQYSSDEQFFNNVAILALKLLESDDLFDPKTLNDTAKQFYNQLFRKLFDDLATLSMRMLTFLPTTLDSTLARRDSVQQSVANQVGMSLASYTSVLSNLMPPHNRLANYVQRRIGFNPAITMQNTTRKLGQAAGLILPPLNAALLILSTRPRDFNDAWNVIASTLWIASWTLQKASPVYHTGIGGKQVEMLIKTVNEYIVPAICQKHPRALPSDFHEALISHISCVLDAAIQSRDLKSSLGLYTVCCSPSNGLMLTSNEYSVSASRLEELCLGDKAILAELLKDSWLLPVLKGYVSTDILDIRSKGIVSLRELLTQTFKVHNGSLDAEHPVIQYLAELLRAGNFTEYIFSADSHANLVKECSDVVGFLAATKTYAEHETDVIWKACTTSVEAEFVKTSFDVLRSMLKMVDADQALYMARKYTSTPSSQLGTYAIPFLSDVLSALRSKSEFRPGASIHLEPARICYEIVKSLDQEARSPLSIKLRKVAISEIMSLNDHGYTMRDRLEFYEMWIAEVNGRTRHATTGLNLITRFLSPKTSEEGKMLVDMFSTQSAVDMLVEFVHDAETSQDAGFFSIQQALSVRLAVVLGLVGLSDDQCASELERRLWTYTIGDRAISSQAREDALDQFVSMAPKTSQPDRVTGLFERCIEQFLPAMSAKYATPRLVAFLQQKIKDIEAKTPQDKLGSVLDTSIWQQLVRIATTSTGAAVSAAALTTINSILFPKRALPISSARMAALMARQAMFARHLIDSLVLPQQEADITKREASIQRIIDILETMYGNSKALDQRDANTAARIVLDPDDANRFTFTVHIHGPQNLRTSIIEAPQVCTAGELNRGLQDLTGVAEHDMVSTGSLTCLMEVCTERLESLGITESSTVSIRPRYTYDCDFGKVFVATDFEQEILSRFEQLEALLGATDAVAEKMFNFLSKVPPPALKRRQMSSPELSTAAIFPVDQQWTTLYSVHVLTIHLQDCNKLGVADQDFILRGARLLSALLLEQDRQLSVHLLSRLLPGLVGFLQGINEAPIMMQGARTVADQNVERPLNKPPPPYLEDAEKLGVRMFEIAGVISKSDFPSKSLDNATTSTRAYLLEHAYSVILQLARTENLWSTLQSTQEFVDAHAAILLNEDDVVSQKLSGLMKGFCIERPDEAPKSYLRTLLSLLPRALTTSAPTIGFFDLFRDAMHLDHDTASDEESVRSIVADLTKCVWSYQHVETADLAIMDDTMCELLRTLSSAIDVLKSFKLPLRLSSISRGFYRFLLFPDLDELDSGRMSTKSSMLLSTTNLTLRPTAVGQANVADTDETASVSLATPSELPLQALPLYHVRSRAICLDILQKTAEPTDAYAWLMAQVTKTVQVSNREMGCFPQGQWLRNPASCAGLTNLGMTCYMNSLLQQLYSNIHFRHFICDVPIVDISKQGLLWHLKALFARLQNLDDNSINTQPLAKYLGVLTDVQDDVHGFYTELLSKLEQEMPDNSTRKQLNQLFSGTLVTQIQGSCGHVSSRTEPFSDLSLTVQNKSTLADSFSEFVQGEPMQGANKYKCMSCEAENGGKLVDAMKRTCLEEAPDHLTVCLKRFTYDMLGQESKINDCFEFPEEIDLSFYKRQHLEQPHLPREPDMFKLVGVIVHSGVLSFGHYWSYVRVRGFKDTQTSRWVRVEDTTARDATTGFEEVRDECFGGRNRSHNGYVLFYQRQSSLEAACQVVDPLKCSDDMREKIPPRVRIPDEVFREVHHENQVRHRTAQLFEDAFHTFVLGICREMRAVGDGLGESGEEPASPALSDRKDNQMTPLVPETIDGQLVDLTFSYITHVLLLERDTRKFQSMTVNFRPDLAHQLLARLYTDESFFSQLMMHMNNDMRTCVRTFITNCLRSIKQSGSAEYLRDVVHLVTSHSRMLSNLDYYNNKWLDYFCICWDVASLGAEERFIVVKAGYFGYILDILSFTNPSGARRAHSALFEIWRKHKVNLGPLYEFLACMFMQPGSLASYDDFSPGGQYDEANALISGCKIDGYTVLPWMLTAIAQPDDYVNGWDNSRASNLIRNLCRSPDPRFQQAVVESALGCFRVEQYFGQQVFYMAANVLSALGDNPREAIRVMRALYSEIQQFQETPRRDMIALLHWVHDAVPLAVVDILHVIASEWLDPRHKVTKRTGGLLKTVLFDPAPVSEQDPSTVGTELDVARARGVRDFVLNCAGKLQDVSEGGDEVGRWHPMLDAMQGANSYLAKLVKVCRQVQENARWALEGGEGDADDIVTLSHEMSIEYDECSRAQRELQRLLLGMREWDAGSLVEEDDEVLEESTDDFVTDEDELP